MLVPTALGVSPVKVRGSKQASLLGKYMSAVGKYLRSGDIEALKEFEGKAISGNSLITDPQVLTALAQAGSLELDRIYALPGAASWSTKTRSKRRAGQTGAWSKVAACFAAVSAQSRRITVLGRTTMTFLRLRFVFPVTQWWRSFDVGQVLTWSVSPIRLNA
jgi:hypothetical protein